MVSKKFLLKISGLNSYFFEILTAILLLVIAFRNWIYTPSITIFLAILATLAGAIRFFYIRKIDGEFLFWAFLFSAFSFVSYLFSETPNLGLTEITMEVAFFLLIVATGKKRLEHAGIIFAPAILLQLGFSIYEYLYLPELRAYGTFLHWEYVNDKFPNALGLFTVLLIPVFCFKKDKFLNRLLLFSLLLSLFLSFSRGAILAVSISLSLGFVFNFLKSRPNYILRNFAILLFVLLSFWGLTQIRTANELKINNIAEKALFNNSEAITSVGERSQFLTKSPLLLKDMGFWGYGPGSFSLVFPKVQTLILANSSHPHNWFLKIIIERGYLALISFLFLLLIFLKRFLKNIDSLLIPFLSLFAALIHNSFDFNFNFPLTFAVLAILTLPFLTKDERGGKKIVLGKKIILVFFILLSFFLTAKLYFDYSAYVIQYRRGEFLEERKEINYEDSVMLELNLLEKENKKEEVFNVLNEYIKISPHDSYALLKRAFLNLSEARFKDAKRDFEKVIELNPLNLVSPYQGLVIAINNSNPQEILKKQEELKNFMDLYLNAAELNLHFTAKSFQIRDAIDLCSQLLNNSYIQNREYWENAKNKLTAISDKYQK